MKFKESFQDTYVFVIAKEFSSFNQVKSFSIRLRDKKQQQLWNERAG